MRSEEGRTRRKEGRRGVGLGGELPSEEGRTRKEGRRGVGVACCGTSLGLGGELAREEENAIIKVDYIWCARDLKIFQADWEEEERNMIEKKVRSPRALLHPQFLRRGVRFESENGLLMLKAPAADLGAESFRLLNREAKVDRNTKSDRTVQLPKALCVKSDSKSDIKATDDIKGSTKSDKARDHSPILASVAQALPKGVTCRPFSLTPR
jgi:hypothetical protein